MHLIKIFVCTWGLTSSSRLLYLAGQVHSENTIPGWLCGQKTDGYVKRLEFHKPTHMSQYLHLITSQHPLQ